MRNKMMKLMATLTLAVMVSLPVAAVAQTLRFAYTSEQLTVAGTAVGFTASKVRQSNTNVANMTTFTVNCASGTACVLRYTIDGTTPTASLGHRAFYGDTISISGYGNNVNFRGIRETADSVVLDVTFLR